MTDEAVANELPAGEMVERVAQALWAEHEMAFPEACRTPWTEALPCTRIRYRGQARATLRALEVPTKGMLDAAWDATRTVSPEARMTVGLMSTRQAHDVKMLRRYGAMIHEALRDGETE